MSIIQYDPENWLLTTVRSLVSYTKNALDPSDAILYVDAGFPIDGNGEWTKPSPLDRTLIHFEQDDATNPTWGFGIVGKSTYTPPAGSNPGTERIDEAQPHMVNFDLGVWASVESGGATARMKYQQELANLFGRAGGKQDLYDATGGIWVVSFSGGRHVLDRVNDMPVWRVTDMTLVVRVVSRHLGQEVVVPDNAVFEEDFTITDDAGNQIPT